MEELSRIENQWMRSIQYIVGDLIAVRFGGVVQGLTFEVLQTSSIWDIQGI
jgi:hypothetical protein